MSSQTDTVTETGVSGQLNWLIGGALGGIVGAVLFGGLLWVIDPAIVTDAIPQLYGLDGGEAVGWLFHLVHGAVLGTIFGFLITRDIILGTLVADVETPFIDALSPSLRIVGAGVVYGLAIWVLLPGIILSTLITLGTIQDPLPLSSAFSLVGHLLYGMLLGALVSLFTDIETDVRESDTPFEEVDDEPEGRRTET